MELLISNAAGNAPQGTKVFKVSAKGYETSGRATAKEAMQEALANSRARNFTAREHISNGDGYLRYTRECWHGQFTRKEAHAFVAAPSTVTPEARLAQLRAELADLESEASDPCSLVADEHKEALQAWRLKHGPELVKLAGAAVIMA